MTVPATDQDTRIRVAVYEATVELGVPPRADDLADRLGLPAAAVRASLERLAAERALVLQRESREVLMANPFSAVPTPFLVTVGDRRYYGNCIWDALGIPAMLARDGDVTSSCGCCGEAMDLQVRSDRLAEASGIVHFAVPAQRWWQDIVFN